MSKKPKSRTPEPAAAPQLGATTRTSLASKTKAPAKPPAQLKGLLQEYYRIKALLDPLEQQLSEIRTSLGEIAASRGGVAETETHKVSLVQSTRRTILQDKLVERGVTPAIIDYATKITEVCYTRIAPKREALTEVR